jgi:hypothetical protein
VLTKPQQQAQQHRRQQWWQQRRGSSSNTDRGGQVARVGRLLGLRRGFLE